MKKVKSWMSFGILMGLLSLPSLAGAAPTGAPLTVSLPNVNLDSSVPISTVIVQPVTTTNIDPSLNYIGFQADFTFDSSVISFMAPVVQAAGLTGSGWTVAGNILPNPPTGIRTLRVSAFVNDGLTPLSGAGVLYNLRMIRVSSCAGCDHDTGLAASARRFSLH